MTFATIGIGAPLAAFAASAIARATASQSTKNGVMKETRSASKFGSARSARTAAP